MQIAGSHILRQPGVGIVTGILAGAAAVATWIAQPRLWPPGLGLSTLLLAASLIAAIILAYQFPIHVHYRLKIEPSSVPIYLLAVLLPPASAITAVGFAVLLAEVRVRAQRGSYPSDIATQVGRMMIAVLLTALTSPAVTVTSPPEAFAKMPFPVVTVTGPTVVTVVLPEPKFSASTPNRASMAPFAVTLTLPVAPPGMIAPTMPALPAFRSPFATIVTLPVSD
jgi:hypothetical protein